MPNPFGSGYWNTGMWAARYWGEAYFAERVTMLLRLLHRGRAGRRIIPPPILAPGDPATPGIRSFRQPNSAEVEQGFDLGGGVFSTGAGSAYVSPEVGGRVLDGASEQYDADL